MEECPNNWKYYNNEISYYFWNNCERSCKINLFPYRNDKAIAKELLEIMKYRRSYRSFTSNGLRNNRAKEIIRRVENIELCNDFILKIKILPGNGTLVDKDVFINNLTNESPCTKNTYIEFCKSIRGQWVRNFQQIITIAICKKNPTDRISDIEYFEILINLGFTMQKILDVIYSEGLAAWITPAIDEDYARKAFEIDNAECLYVAVAGEPKNWNYLGPDLT